MANIAKYEHTENYNEDDIRCARIYLTRRFFKFNSIQLEKDYTDEH